MAIWNPRANDIFLKAVNAVSRDERQALVKSECGDDAELRAEVESLLAVNVVIGGTAGSPGLVTIDASDASGIPLVQTSGFALADSLTSSSPFDEGVIGSAGLSTATTGSADLATPMIGNSVGSNNPAPVPEPSTLALALLAVLGLVSIQFARNHFRCQTV
jgi:hypothetical protein